MPSGPAPAKIASGASAAASAAMWVAATDAQARRAELDEEAGRIDTTEWFNQ